MTNKSAKSRSRERQPCKSDLEVLARQIEQRLTSIRQKLRRPLEVEFARGQLTGPQRSVMRVIVSAREPMRLREVTAAVGLAQSTVSGIVERLVQRGMLVRTEDPADARAARLAPSAAVRHFIESRMPKLTLSPLLAALRKGSTQDAQAIAAALERLEELLEKA